MTIAWMLYVLLVGALLSVGAWGVEDALRYAKLPTRWAWAAAMLGTVAFAGYALHGATVPASVIPDFTSKMTASAGAAAPSTNGFASTMEAVRAGVTASLAAATARVPSGVVRWALIAWVAASAALLLMHLAVNRRVIQQRRTWPFATLPGGTVRVAPTLGPAVVGLASPEIVVPRWLLEKSSEEQHLVMVHEQEHIAARDQYMPVAALLVATVLPWHPAVWWSLVRLRLAVELDCDARVLRRGIHARPYGSLLIDIAGQCAGHRTGALALADRPSHLERRLRAMTYRSSRYTLARTIGLAAVAALAIVTACEARLPTSSEVQAMDVAGAEKAMVQSKMLDERAAGNVVYVVNGETVSAEKAHAIPSDHIASVNVLKGAATAEGTRPTTIRIVTSDSLVSGAHMKVYAENSAQPSGQVRKGTLMRKEKFDGLLFVDGVRAPEGALARLTPDQIASVDVLKGEAAKAFSSDPAAANGIIKITTKHAKQ